MAILLALESTWIVLGAPANRDDVLVFLLRGAIPGLAVLALTMALANRLLARERALVWHVAAFATAGAGSALLLGAALAPYTWDHFAGPPVLTVQLRLLIYAVAIAAVARLVAGVLWARRASRRRTSSR